MSNGNWKLLYNDKRRCRIFACQKERDGLCCADCARDDCNKRCLNSPDRCGQVIRREPKEKEAAQQQAKDAAAKEHFYSEKDDAWETSAFTRKRRI